MNEEPEDDDLEPEYGFSRAVRGKYYQHYQEGTNVGRLREEDQKDATARDRRCIGAPPGLSAQETNTMSDLTKYTQDRVVRDPEFADGLEVGYRDFGIPNKGI